MLIMDNCDNNHDEIIFLRDDGCPCCALNERVQELEKEVEFKDKVIDSLKDDLAQAKSNERAD